jgi:sulfopyruvate decarboxylase subunit alpha
MLTTSPTAPTGVDVAERLCHELVGAGLGPFLGTPCGILAPLYSSLQADAGLITVAREDNAVGVAAGAALAGGHPVVLMQNSGLGQSVNALASLVTPYRLPMLLIVSLRGIDPDPTQENLVMGRLTGPLLDGLGIPAAVLDTGELLGAQVRWAADMVRQRRRPAALLVPPSSFGWSA